MFAINWEHYTNSASSVDEAASVLLHLLYTLFDAHFPTRTIRKRHDDPPWMKPSLNMLIDKRDKAFSQGKKQKYLRLRKEVVKHTKVLKRRFIIHASVQRHSGKAWAAIKNIGCLSTKSKTPIKFSAEDMNASFAASFNSNTDHFAAQTPASYSAPNHPLRVTVAEVGRLLRSTKKKSPGPDGVPHWILQRYANLLSPAVTRLFNQSFEDGRVPACFKEAIITPRRFPRSLVPRVRVTIAQFHFSLFFPRSQKRSLRPTGSNRTSVAASKPISSPTFRDREQVLLRP